MKTRISWSLPYQTPPPSTVTPIAKKAGSMIGRFEAERQTLAMMDHPNIAHVFDGGATESGRPYFVMELVRGMAITKYCDEAKLTTEERLQLFISVCDAVQHAHQKGIIHRDIKPRNVLVTLHGETPCPRSSTLAWPKRRISN